MRLFLALDLGEDVHKGVEAALKRARKLAPDARWVDPGKLHLTLAFLGSVEDERLEDASACAKATASRFPVPEIAVRGAGTFGGRSRPRVLWAGIECEGLAPIAEDLAARLRKKGFELEERAFKPHLTLARARESRGDAGLAKAAAALAEAEVGRARPEALLVIESHLSPKGSRYEVRASAPFGR